jgi:hypothetical protein
MTSMLKWLRCYLDHRGHAWASSSSSELRWRRCTRCTLAIVDGPAGRLRAFDTAGDFDPLNRIPPPRVPGVLQ